MRNNLIKIAISVVVAFALWMYVVMVIGPEYQDTFRDVKVELVGKSALEAQNLMIIGDDNYTVDLVLSGNRSDLNKLSSSNISVTLDLSKILDPGKTAHRYDISFPGNVAKDSITVQTQSPTGITLEVVRKAYNTVDVQIEYDDSLIPAGYGVLPVEQELDKLSIEGPEDVINQIAVAKISLAITEENNKSDISGEYMATLCDAEGQEVDSRYVTVTTAGAEKIAVKLPIRMKKELPLKAHILDGGGLTAQNVTLAPASITVLGREEDLQDLNELYINTPEEPLDLRMLTSETVLEPFPLVLPEDLVNKSGLTEVTVKVSFDNVKQKEFTIMREQLLLLNVPEGMIPEISEQQLKIVVRGLYKTVDALTAADILVSVDFAEAKIDQMKEWPVSIVVKGEGSDVGVIGGPYTVYVEIVDAAKVVDVAAEILQE